MSEKLILITSPPSGGANAFFNATTEAVSDFMTAAFFARRLPRFFDFPIDFYTGK